MLQRSDLRHYQERAVTHVKQHSHCALWLDMGLGKSISTLTALSDLISTLDARRALVVAPLRVSRKVWPDEIREWQHVSHLSFSRIIGTPAQRWRALNTEADIHLINRENLPWLEAQFIDVQARKQLRRWPWDTVILDESQSFKAQGAQRFKSMRRLRRLDEMERLVELTGTPAPNGYKDLWAQIYLLDHGERLGHTEKDYLNRWFDQGHNGYGYVLKPHAAAEIHEKLKDIVLTMRAEDYLELPPVQNNYVRVELSGAVMALYKKLEREYLAEFKNKQVTAVNAGMVAGKLMQVANGAVYYDDKRNWVDIHDGKIEALLETLESASGPVLIAYSYKHDLERLKLALTKFCGKDKTWDILKTPLSEAKWNAGETDYLLLHPASAGHGLNLQKSGSETIVWFGLTNNLELYAQLNARLIGGHRRTGKNVILHHIIADGTIDTDLIALLDNKHATQEDLKIALAEKARLL